MACATGPGSDNLLNNDGDIAPGEYVTVTVTVTVDPDATGSSTSMENQSTAFADGPSGEVGDDSDSGVDPNSMNPVAPGDSGGSNDPTPIAIPDVRVTKAVVGTPAELANGNYSVIYQLVLENTGSVDMSNLQLTDDLESQFGSGVFVGVVNPPAIVTAPSLPGSVAPMLAAYDGGLSGSGNTTIFAGTTGLLVPGDSLTVQFEIEVSPNGNGAGDAAAEHICR